MVANLIGKSDFCPRCLVQRPRCVQALTGNLSSTYIPLAASETYPSGPEDKDENKARVLVEKKTAINLLEAFAVAVKHYLRGEDGIY